MTPVTRSLPVLLFIATACALVCALLVPSAAQAAPPNHTTTLPPELCQNVPVDPHPSWNQVCKRGNLAPGLVKQVMAQPFFTGASSPARGQLVITGFNLNQLSSVMFGVSEGLGSPHYYDPASSLGSLNPPGAVVLVYADRIIIDDPWLGGQTLTNVGGYDSLGRLVTSYDFADVVVTPVLDPPTVAITSPANGDSLTVDDALIGFTATSEQLTITCAVDGAAPAPCSSPLALTDLALGSHSVTVAASNPAGEASATTSFTVDVPAPTAVITNAPYGLIYGDSAVVHFSAFAYEASPSCALNGEHPWDCGSPQILTGLTPGSHTFTITVSDRYGRSATASVELVVAAPPSAQITSGPADGSTITDPTAGPSYGYAIAGDTVSTSCSVDGSPAGPCDGNIDADALGVGDHTVEVVATSPAGEARDSRTYTVAYTPPQATIDAAPASGMATSLTSEVQFSSTGGPVSATECQVDEGAFEACASPHSFTLADDGAHTVRVRMTGPGGQHAASASFTITLRTKIDTASSSQPGRVRLQGRGFEHSPYARLVYADGGTTKVALLGGISDPCCGNGSTAVNQNLPERQHNAELGYHDIAFSHSATAGKTISKIELFADSALTTKVFERAVDVAVAALPSWLPTDMYGIASQRFYVEPAGERRLRVRFQPSHAATGDMRDVNVLSFNVVDAATNQSRNHTIFVEEDDTRFDTPGIALVDRSKTELVVEFATVADGGFIAADSGPYEMHSMRPYAHNFLLGDKSTRQQWGDPTTNTNYFHYLTVPNVGSGAPHVDTVRYDEQAQTVTMAGVGLLNMKSARLHTREWVGGSFTANGPSFLFGMTPTQLTGTRTLVWSDTQVVMKAPPKNTGTDVSHIELSGASDGQLLSPKSEVDGDYVPAALQSVVGASWYGRILSTESTGAGNITLHGSFRVPAANESVYAQLYFTDGTQQFVSSSQNASWMSEKVFSEDRVSFTASAFAGKTLMTVKLGHQTPCGGGMCGVDANHDIPNMQIN